MKSTTTKFALAGCAVLALGATIAHAQVATTLERVELAGLTPGKRAEVQARAVNGNSVSEVLQTILLNSIKLKHPASQILALDFNRGAAGVKLADGKTTIVNFDPTTLAIKS